MSFFRNIKLRILATYKISKKRAAQEVVVASGSFPLFPCKVALSFFLLLIWQHVFNMFHINTNLSSIPSMVFIL